MVAASLIATISEEDMTLEDVEVEEDHESGEMAEMNQYLNGRLP